MIRLALNGPRSFTLTRMERPRLLVRDAEARAERMGSVRRRQRILIEDFAARGAPSMMKSAVPRRLAALRNTLDLAKGGRYARHHETQRTGRGRG